MSGGAALPPPRGAYAVAARALTTLRHVGGVLVGGLLGGILWLVIMQEGPERGWSEHDYNQMIGQLLVDRSGDVEHAGLWATLVAGVALATVYAVAFDRLSRRLGAIGASLAFAVVPLLLWGLALSPLTTAYVDTVPGVPRRTIPGGPFGLDGGTGALVLGVIASIAFGLVAGRVYRLMQAAEWWRSRGARHEMAEEVLSELAGGSLELPEEMREERSEGSGR